MTLVTKQQLEAYRDENTRQIKMPDGSLWEVRMTPQLWESLELLKSVDGVTEGQLGIHALEEMELQPVTFDQAFRGIVAHLANRWS